MISGASVLAGKGFAQGSSPGPVQNSEDKRNPSAKPPAVTPPWLTLPPTPHLPVATRSGTVAIRGANIYFAQFGEGPPVLLLHGGLGNSEYWGHQVRDLARNFSVTVMDTRGHGRSPLTLQAFSYRLFADDVIGLLDFLQIPAAAIVGWSDGGVTGLELAISKPNRVTKLFAFGANSNPGGYKPSSSRVFNEYATRCKVEYNRLSPHPERWHQLMSGLSPMWRTEPNYSRQKLATVTIPTAISTGEHDEIIRRDHTEQMAREIPGARLVIQPNVSHFAMLQNAPQFTQAVGDFLMSNDGK
jgi:pimeloyl-ACP methyl ester carboxylesterase